MTKPIGVLFENTRHLMYWKNTEIDKAPAGIHIEWRPAINKLTIGDREYLLIIINSESDMFKCYGVEFKELINYSAPNYIYEELRLARVRP